MSKATGNKYTTPKRTGDGAEWPWGADGTLQSPERPVLVPDDIPLSVPHDGVLRLIMPDGSEQRHLYVQRVVFELQGQLDGPVPSGTRYYVPFIEGDTDPEQTAKILKQFGVEYDDGS